MNELNDVDRFAIMLIVSGVMFCLLVKFIAWFFMDDDDE